MSDIKILVERSDMVAIADAVRSKTDTTDEMTIGEIINGINNIHSGEGGTDISSLKFKEGVYNTHQYDASYMYYNAYLSTQANVATLKDGRLYLVKVGENNNGKFIPDFFKHYNSTTELYVDVSSLMSSSGCVLNLVYLNGESVFANGTMNVSNSWVITIQPEYVQNNENVLVELEGNIYVICHTASSSNNVSNTTYGKCNTATYISPSGNLYPFNAEYEKICSDTDYLVKVVSNLDETGVKTLYNGEINTEQSQSLVTLYYNISSSNWYVRTSGWSFNMISSKKFEESELPFIRFYTSAGGGAD